MFMAQQYITIENQNLLWKTINRSPQFVNNTIQINKEQWFSGIIKRFYEQIKSPSLSMAELKTLNQQTIAYMVGDLKRIESLHIPYTPTPQGAIEPSHAPQSAGRSLDFAKTNWSSPNILSGAANAIETPQTRMSMYNDQFNARQQEYTNMIKPPAPPIADFSEKVEEDAITNMEELLQQQIKQREYDVAQVRPPPPAALTGNTTPIEPLSPSKPVASQYTNLESLTTIIQDLTKQLAELRDEVRVIKENAFVKTPVIQSDRTEDVEDAI
uniref:Uncharacterized protein n=1 Tax=viral metagenome TaxID=1070528 RepID=A0A6C0HH53_9ZZZZ